MGSLYDAFEVDPEDFGIETVEFEISPEAVLSPRQKLLVGCTLDVGIKPSKNSSSLLLIYRNSSSKANQI